jgi:hypothetical protein
MDLLPPNLKYGAAQILSKVPFEKKLIITIYCDYRYETIPNFSDISHN